MSAQIFNFTVSLFYNNLLTISTHSLNTDTIGTRGRVKTRGGVRGCGRGRSAAIRDPTVQDSVNYVRGLSN